MTKNPEALLKLIKYHDELYGKGTPEISDAEYDALRNRLLAVAPEMLDNVPEEGDSLFPKYSHTLSIKSLSKVNDVDTLREKLKEMLPVCIEPKFDGLTVVFYPDGKKVTRGNGEIGDDISANMAAVHRSDVQYDKPVRVEAMMSVNEFFELNEYRKSIGLEEFKNPRNAAAGILRSKESQYIENITYRAYNIVGSSLPQSEQIKELRANKFLTTDSWSFSKDELEEAVEFVVNFDRDGYEFELDGLVIKSDIENANEVYGETGHHPKSMFAYKFPAQGVWTKLIDVIWQTGRTGKVTPVGILEPTDLMGSVITRVTLHNYSIMSALKLSKGCDVFLIKANDVIPAIIESKWFNPILAFKEPTHCPECASSVKKEKDLHFCSNIDCKSRLLFNICHLAKRDALDITGLSEQTAEKMIEAGFISTPSDIFNLSSNDIRSLPGFADKSAQNLYDRIKKAQTNTPLNRFLYAAGIPNIGRSASKDIANALKTYESIESDVKNDCHIISQIEGFGPIMIDSLKEGWSLIALLRKYIEPIEIKEEKRMATNKEQLTFVITGTLENPRKHYEAIITDAGHKVSGSVSKSTSYLLAGEKAGSKMKKAQDLGVPVITNEAELLLLL